MLDLGFPRMIQTGIIDVHVQAGEGVSVCCKTRGSVFGQKSTCAEWRGLDLAESNTPQTGPIWRSPIWFLHN